MDPFEEFGHRSDVRKEERFRRTVALQIYLPIFVSIVLLAALAVGVGSSGSGAPSVLADVALILVLLPVFVVLLVAVAAVTALVVGISRLPHWVRIGGRRAGAIVDRVSTGAKSVADGAAKPVIALHGVAAVVRRAGGLLGSLFRGR